MEGVALQAEQAIKNTSESLLSPKHRGRGAGGGWGVRLEKEEEKISAESEKDKKTKSRKREPILPPVPFPSVGF